MKIVIFGVAERLGSATRDDAAAFIMSELLEGRYIRQVPVICSQKKSGPFR